MSLLMKCCEYIYWDLDLISLIILQIIWSSSAMTSLCLLRCSHLLPFPTWGYAMLCWSTLLSSSLQLCCPSLGHWDRELTVLGFQPALHYVWVFEDICLCFVEFVPHSRSLFLLQSRSFFLSLVQSFPSLIGFCFSLPMYYLLSPDPPSSNLSEKVNAALLAAAESALM